MNEQRGNSVDYQPNLRCYLAETVSLLNGLTRDFVLSLGAPGFSCIASGIIRVVCLRLSVTLGVTLGVCVLVNQVEMTRGGGKCCRLVEEVAPGWLVDWRVERRSGGGVPKKDRDATHTDLN